MTVPGELCLLARFLDPTDAHVLVGRLQAEGICTVVADANLVQAHLLIAIAVGGVRVLVPGEQLGLAREVVAAVGRGDYAIGEDFDVGPLDS